MNDRWKWSLLAALAAFALSLFLPRAGMGQAVSGNIVGTVTDPAGAAIPNAQVTISDLDRGTTYQTVTNTDGNFTQTHLLAGRYQVKIVASGFAPFETT